MACREEVRSLGFTFFLCNYMNIFRADFPKQVVDFDVAEGVVNRLVTEDEEEEREGIAEV